jgi:hypothetical protein
VTSSLVFPDVMVDLRYWLRNDPTLNPLHGGRVFFRLPKTTQAPMVRLTRIGGGVQTNSETPLQDISVIMEVWGMQNSDYQAVRQLSLAIESVCHQYVPGTPLNPTGNTIMHNANFTYSADAPDPDTGWPRIMNHAQFTVIASTPTVVA